MCRSGDDEPNGGVVGWNGVVTGEFFQHYRGLTVTEDSGASWDNATMAEIRHNH